MNMMKKNGGFTLVELIVVIAILAILAGVAVPAYSGYITKANEAADVTQLDAIKTAAVFAAVDADNDITVNNIDLTVSGSDLIVVVNKPASGTGGTTVDIDPYYTFNGFKSAKYAAGASWADGVWTGKAAS